MEDGQALNPGYISRDFQKIRQQSEPLPELTFCGLRHSAASLMLAGGAEISTHVKAARQLLDCDSRGRVRAKY
jgi:integrase